MLRERRVAEGAERMGLAAAASALGEIRSPSKRSRGTTMSAPIKARRMGAEVAVGGMEKSARTCVSR